MMNEEEISICNAVMPDYVSTISMQLKEIEIMYGSCQYSVRFKYDNSLLLFIFEHFKAIKSY